MIRHYAAGVPDAVNGKWEPQELCGFDLADVSSQSKLNNMPANVDGLVYLGAKNGVDQAFKDLISRWKLNPKVWGYYVVDEPVPFTGSSSTYVSIQTMKEMVDYIRQEHPTAKTFVKCTNEGPVDRPRWSYTPANTGLDYIGVGGYAVRSRFPGNYDPDLIQRYVESALRDGIPLAVIVPCYQCFGGAPDWPVPTKFQMDDMFKSWRKYVPSPAWDYAYRWNVQPTYGNVDLGRSEMMRASINEHFRLQAEPPTPELVLTVIVGDNVVYMGEPTAMQVRLDPHMGRST